MRERRAETERLAERRPLCASIRRGEDLGGACVSQLEDCRLGLPDRLRNMAGRKRTRADGSGNTQRVAARTPTGQPASAPWSWAIPLLLVGGGLAAFSDSFKGAFLLDDLFRIVRNEEIRKLWPPWTLVVHSGRPLVQLTLAVNYALGGLDVWGYHAFNLTVHLFAGLLLFGIVRRMLESDELRARYSGAAPWLAGAIAILWTVHPLQTESVTYIIQRGESMMGLFFLLTLYCTIRGASSPHPRGWYLAAIVACALGMGSKEVMVTAPLVVLLYDRMFLSPSFKDLFQRRWRLYAGLAATWLVAAASLANSREEEQVILVAGLTPWSYALTQP